MRVLSPGERSCMLATEDGIELEELQHREGTRLTYRQSLERALEA
jgi:hypothetical protein